MHDDTHNLPSNCANLDPIVERFKTRIKHFGAQPSAVLWSDGNLQILRFQALIELIDNENTNIKLSLVDFGCGYGAFFTFLKKHGLMINRKYTGYDITKEMILNCLENIHDKSAEFIHDNKLQKPADYVFVSGTFGLRCSTEHATWEAMVKSNLLHLWNNSSKGLAFNLLSDSHSVKDPELYYANAKDYLEFCTGKMSHNIKYIDGPVFNEFTILVRR